MGDGLIKAEDVEPEEIEWLWRERIPRQMITVIAGRPEEGKGLTCCHITAELTRQGLNVLYSADEDSKGLMTRPRLEAAGANLSRVLLLENENSLRLPADMAQLEIYIRTRKLDLIILDPWAEHLSDGITAGADGVRKATKPLKQLLERTNAGCIVVEHALKRIPKNSHPLSAIRGNSSGLVAASRMGFIFGRDPDDEESRWLCHVKGNIRDKAKAIRFTIDVVDNDKGEAPFLLFNEEREFDVMKLFEGKGGQIGRPADKREAACKWLTNYLFAAGKPVKATVVFEDAKHVGMSKKTVRRAREEMGVIVVPPDGGRHCTWELPDELIDLQKAKQGGEGGEVDPTTITDDDISRLLEGPLGGAPAESDEDEESDDE